MQPTGDPYRKYVEQLEIAGIFDTSGLMAASEGDWPLMNTPVLAGKAMQREAKRLGFA